ncbi:MAG: glycosyltransferase family A protein [Desulfuromonadales bacterium]|nr:glycosyltransferase family A protein [Desulfuromonadales bacterium]
MYNDFVTIAIITRDRRESLGRTLDVVCSLNYPNYEVIVVDNGSIDNTEEVVRAHNAKYIRGKIEDGFSGSRQRALDNSSGEIIIWCDDDCMPMAGWVESYVAMFNSDHGFGMIGGGVVNINFPQKSQFKGRSVLGINGQLHFVEDPYTAEFYGNLNLAMRRSVVDEIGGYDPYFVGGLEEIDLAFRVRSHGYKVGYNDKAVVEHYHNEVNYKKGRLFKGQQFMRLYFFLKNCPPRTAIVWVKFVLNEMDIFCREFFKCCKAILSFVKNKNIRMLHVNMIEMTNIVSSRFWAPLILYRASRSQYK